MYERCKKFTVAFLAASLLFASLGAAAASAAGNETNDSFSKAKKMLERQVYFDHRITLYCGHPLMRRKTSTCPMASIRKSTRSVLPKSSGNTLYLQRTLGVPSKNGETVIRSVWIVRERPSRDEPVQRR